MNRNEIATTLYSQMLKVTADIAERDSFYGQFATRKMQHVSADTDLDMLVKVSNDLRLIAKKIG